MSYDKSELMQLSDEEKRELAFELLESIDEAYTKMKIPAWKQELIRERLSFDKEGPDDALPWGEVKKKYMK